MINNHWNSLDHIGHDYTIFEQIRIVWNWFNSNRIDYDGELIRSWTK